MSNGQERGWSVTWKFEHDSFDLLKTIAEAGQYSAGKRIFNEGDRPDGMYLITEGSVMIVRKSKSGDEKNVARATVGQSFGEIGLLIDKPRQASVIAETNVSVLKITPYVLQWLHKNAMDMALMMYQILARSLAEQLLLTQEMQRPE